MPAGRSRPGQAAAAGLVLAAALLCAGCSINPQWQLARGDAPAEPVLLGVPFHPQTEYQCGPAALATVLGASGVPITPEALVPQVYLPGRQGSLQPELVAATRRAGRIPYLVDQDPSALLEELHAGRPVLVLQNLLVRSVPRWHYAVVVGYDAPRQKLLLRSGQNRLRRESVEMFESTWRHGEFWMLSVHRPGEIPPIASEQQLRPQAVETVVVLANVLDEQNRSPRHRRCGGAAHAGEQCQVAADQWSFHDAIVQSHDLRR